MKRAEIATLGLLALALASLGCEEEPPKPNHVPELVEGSAAITCTDSGDPDLGLILAGGEVSVIDENLVSVEVSIGGLETVQLTGEAVAEPDFELPQHWSFQFDIGKKVVCNSDLVMVFTARDEKGESAWLSASAQ